MLARAAVIAVALLAPAALGHGGAYQRPQPLGPMTGVDAADAARFGRSPVGGAATGGPLVRSGRTGGGDGEFDVWWQDHEGALFAAALRDGARQPAPDAARLERAGAFAPVQEVLQAALRDDASDVVDSALIAIGRIARGGDADAAFQAAWPLIAHPSEAIRRSALLSMGLSDSPRAVPVLLSFLHSTGPSDPVTNGIAALGLGLRSAPSAVAELCRTANGDAALELRQAAVAALGFYRPAAGDGGESEDTLREIVGFLAAALAAREFPPEVLSQVPIALGRLGEAAVPARATLAAAIGDGRIDRRVRRTAIIALGRVASPDDAATLQRLRGLARSLGEPELRGPAILALGRIAARSRPDSDLSGAAAAETRAFLRTSALAPPSGGDAPWYALALAFAAGAADATDTERGAAAAALRALLGRNDVRARAAAALVLGLVRDAGAEQPLLEALAPGGDPRVAGAAARALALLGTEAARGPLRDLALEAPDRALRDAAAEALAALAPAVAESAFQRALSEGSSEQDGAWAARMLGETSSSSALPLLVRLAGDAERPTPVRAFALVGLGRLLEAPGPSWRTWKERLLEGADPASACLAERELLDLY